MSILAIRFSYKEHKSPPIWCSWVTWRPIEQAHIPIRHSYSWCQGPLGPASTGTDAHPELEPPSSVPHTVSSTTESWRLEAQDRGLAGWMSCEASLPGLWKATFSLCPYKAFPLGIRTDTAHPRVSFSSYKAIVLLD